MKTVLIFGGSGFVGKHIIHRIAKNGYKIVVPHQNQVNEAKLRLFGTTGQIVPIRFQSIKEDKISNLINNADVIINLKTLWDEKKISFKKGIFDFNEHIVKSIKKSKKNPQFIYFSGLAVDKNIYSKRSKSIFDSEQYIYNNLKNAIIIRPGIILGGGDQFLKGLIPLFKISFFIPLFGTGLSRFQPVFIDDISVAIKIILEISLSDKHLFEFVGSEIITYREFYNYLAKCMNRKRILVPLAFIIVKIIVFFLEKTPFSPLNSEQLKLFQEDNIASNKYKKFDDIGLKPQDIRLVVKGIVDKNQ